MTTYTRTFTTALGLFSVATDETGAVLATAFGDETALQNRLQKCHVLRATSLAPQADNAGARGPTAQAVAQIQEYAAGRRPAFSLRLTPVGTAFQLRVWAELQKIPRGETRNYGDLAKSLKTAARAVGRANATNPICLIVPCHRVIGADGSLTGFAFGEKIKRQLLELEGVFSATGPHA
jgi:methylated-DNA-[protein]-cysteine S-methyltransferase